MCLEVGILAMSPCCVPLVVLEQFMCGRAHRPVRGGYLFCSSFRWVVSVILPSTGMPAPKVLQQRCGVAQ